MAQQVNVRTDKDHRDALDAMAETDQADSKAEAMRQTSRAELARRGYLTGGSNDTVLRRVIREIGRLCIYAGVAWVGISYFFPIALRLPAIGILSMGLVCFGLDELLAKKEPGITNWMHGLFGGEKA